MSTDDRYGDPTVSAVIRIGPDTRLAVVRPGSPEAPFYVYLGMGPTAISADRADLTRLRDALTEALDADTTGTHHADGDH